MFVLDVSCKALHKGFILDLACDHFQVRKDSEQLPVSQPVQELEKGTL